MNTKSILAALADNPGAIATEIGATPVEMAELEAKGLVTRLGNRKTGKRGRPPVEWAVTGAEVQQDERVTDAILKAQERVADHRTWERLSSMVMLAGNEYGYNSEQRRAAVAARREAFPDGPPKMPTTADYTKIGAAVEVPEGLAS